VTSWNLFRRWLTRICWSWREVVTCGLPCREWYPTLHVACTRCARLVTVQPNALHVTCDATCCFEAPTISIPFIFRMSWHMRIDVCSIMNELFLSNVILSMLWHKEKCAKLTIHVLQGSRAFTKYCQTTYYRTGFYGDYSNTCKDRRSTDIIYMNFMPVQNKVKEKYLKSLRF